MTYPLGCCALFADDAVLCLKDSVHSVLVPGSGSPKLHRTGLLAASIHVISRVSGNIFFVERFKPCMFARQLLQDRAKRVFLHIFLYADIGTHIASASKSLLHGICHEHNALILLVRVT